MALKPTTRIGTLISYAQVSMPGRPQRALAEAGYLRVFVGELPGKTCDRAELAACPGLPVAPATLVVTSLDRLSWS